MKDKFRSSKKRNFYIITCLTLFQLATVIWFSCVLTFYSIYIHLTNWSFFMSTIYLLLLLISDTIYYIFSSKKLEPLNYFIRNSFSKVVYPYCFLITIGFWGILLVGLIFSAETFTKSGAKISAFRVICNLHLHCGITIIMLIELFLNKRKEMKLTLESGIANTLIFISYIIMVCVAKYRFNKNAYVFMGNLGIFPIFLVGITIFVLLIICIFIYNAVSNRINREYIKNGNGNDNNLINEEEIPDDDSEFILGKEN